MRKRELFLTLFYRERIGRLAEYIQYRYTPRRKTTRCKIADMLKEIVIRAEDDTICNDICKSMYFCDLKKGHKGPHREDSGLTWK